jgi:hypothetical protein
MPTKKGNRASWAKTKSTRAAIEISVESMTRAGLAPVYAAIT